ncbi:MAG: DNA-directed RNA polymerase subunit omega [Planctomycetota bacterium]
MDFRKIQEAQERFGGPFKVTSLLQKRVRELVLGSKPLIETDLTRPIDIALEELLKNKLDLEPPGEESAAAGVEGFSVES